MIATFREIAPEEAKWIDEDDAKALKVFEKHGNTIYRLTPAEWKEFQKLAPPVWNKFVCRERREGGVLYGEAEGGRCRSRSRL